MAATGALTDKDNSRTRGAAPAAAAPGPLDDKPLVIGLVNNMPDAALRNTERQFRALLAAGAPGRHLQLRFFSIPEIPRSELGSAYVAQNYEDIGALWTADLAGLIVTGTEPRLPALQEEPYWGTLARLAEWAEDHTFSTIWSCLGTHAAVLHLDGIERQPLGRKLSGVFDCIRAGDHPILAGMPARWGVPHSRHNGLSEPALLTSGYRILSRSPIAGVDSFLRQRNSLFLFWQGHPEYERATLLREYRRDVGRFLAGERECYPEMPAGYFDDAAAAELAAFAERARRERNTGLFAAFPEIAEPRLAHGWHMPALQLCANWLSYLDAQRAQRARGAAGAAAAASAAPF